MSPPHPDSSRSSTVAQAKLEVFAQVLQKTIELVTSNRNSCILASSVGLKTGEKLGLGRGRPLPLKGFIFRFDSFQKFLAGGETNPKSHSDGIARVGRYDFGEGAPHREGHLSFELQGWMVDPTIGQGTLTELNLTLPEILVTKLPDAFEHDGICASTDPANPTATQILLRPDPYYEYTKSPHWTDTETIELLAEYVAEKTRAAWRDLQLEEQPSPQIDSEDTSVDAPTKEPDGTRITRAPRRRPLSLNTATTDGSQDMSHQSKTPPCLLATSDDRPNVAVEAHLHLDDHSGNLTVDRTSNDVTQSSLSSEPDGPDLTFD